MEQAQPHEPVVVIGASAGGIEALVQLIASLPGDFAAPVLVVVHISPSAGGALPSILNRAGRLPAAYAQDHQALRPGHVLVAPPDRHLCVVEGHVVLNRGPREDGHRPSVNTLFRSAARAHGRQVIGVVLSGALDDGAAGAAEIKRAGGKVFVQDPEEALYKAMPSNAIASAEPDVVAPSRDLGQAIVALLPPARERGGGSPGQRAPEPAGKPHDRPSSLTCPDCGGVLWQGDDPVTAGYRCRVGHRWSPHSLDEAHTTRVENALWAATRMLEDRSRLLGELAERAKAQGRLLSAEQFDTTAEQALRDAAMIRSLLTETRE